MKEAGLDLGELKEAHLSAARMVVAATHAPRRSGRLAGTVRGSGTKTAAVVRAGRSSVPYAGPIHWGWRARHIRPNPFLTRAAQETEPAWTEVYLAQVESILGQIRGA